MDKIDPATVDPDVSAAARAMGRAGRGAAKRRSREHYVAIGRRSQEIQRAKKAVIAAVIPAISTPVDV